MNFRSGNVPFLEMNRERNRERDSGFCAGRERARIALTQYANSRVNKLGLRRARRDVIYAREYH